MEMKDIPGYEGLYAVTENGEIYSYHSKRFLKQQNHPSGYSKVNLYKDGSSLTQYTHRLVATTWIPNPLGLPEINHRDENKKNNAVSNLEWTTHKENVNYGTRNNRIAKPVRCIETGIVYRSQGEAAEAIGFSVAAISMCLSRKNGTCAGYHWEFAEREEVSA